MDINSSYITGSNINTSSLPNLPKPFDSEGNAFLSLLETALEQNPEYIYMAHHNILSEEQMADLAGQYDPENMDGEQYKAFLDELVGMGAISEADREKLKGVNMTMHVSGYSGENGQWIDLTQEEAEDRFGRSGDTLSGADNNLQKLLQDLKSRLPGQKEELDALSEITDTISAMRQRAGLGSFAESGPNSLMEQAKDINSELWMNLRRDIIENAREKEELRKEEEKIKLLSTMIDNATGRNDPRVSAAVGLKLGLNADQEIFKAGYMPSELHTYLLSLSGGKTTFEMVDGDEQEDGRAVSVEGASAEKLHTGRELPDDKLLDLAENFDPNNMTPEQYDEFLEKLVELGVLSQEAIERVGWHGMFAEYGREIPITCTGPQNFTPAFQLSPVDNDIEGWIQNRLLWKPGITRESAKRDGFAPQYDRIAEDEKTLSIISEVLSGIKRQREASPLRKAPIFRR